MSDSTHPETNPGTDLASLWIGEALGPLEQISALSFLAAGNTLTVYTYTDGLRGVPPGVKVRDAREIMPGAASGDGIVRHRKTGSPALHSDLFRYQLMARTDAVWVDLDIVALRRLDARQPYLIGWESAHDVNGAVLRLPRTSQALQALLAYRPDTVGYPAYFPPLRRLKYAVRSLGRGLSLVDWPWGAIGPRALAHHLRQTGEIGQASPVARFYPVPVDGAGRFAQPAAPLDGHLSATPGVDLVHFWGSQLRRIIHKEHGGQIPTGSWMDSQRLRLMDYSGTVIARNLE